MFEDMRTAIAEMLVKVRNADSPLSAAHYAAALSDLVAALHIMEM